MKNFSVFLIFMLFLAATVGYGNTNKDINQLKKSNYSIRFIPASENEYEGNLIVNVLDSKGNELVNARLEVTSTGKKISVLNLEDTSLGVFFHEENKLTLKVALNGYVEVITSEFTIERGKAAIIEFRLSKKLK